jgi:hypothetical protein
MTAFSAFAGEGGFLRSGGEVIRGRKYVTEIQAQPNHLSVGAFS